ncbi:MAG TPA: hypothetical protein VFO94_13100 [Gammaproteobacteria bacterium]|nr:hypothetical protein [Gammaproteobacteria bacterium]
MSDRAQELAERRAALRLRCAVQRRAIAHEVRGVEARLDTVDRVTRIARNVASHPAVILGGAIFAVALARTRGFRVLTQGLMLVSGIRRLARLIVRQ